MGNNKNAYDEEICTNLREEIHSTKIVVSDDQDKYFELIENGFQTSSGRIKWKRESLILNKGDIENTNEWQKMIHDALVKIAIENKITNELFHVVGDNLMDKTYSMRLDTFLIVFWDFFSVPQHTFAISDDGKYCINYTFEDDLFFGIRAKY